MSNVTVNFCGFICATTSPIGRTVFINFVFLHLYLLLFIPPLTPRFIRVLSENGFRNANFFGMWGLVGVGVTIFDEAPKGTSLDDFTRFEPLCVQLGSGVFPLGEATKKGTLQKVTETLYFTYLRGIPQ